ncbi:hypothetical protein [Imhoffiella purpurea]|uniref:hypothetical protein n=1 Tax=Imhoffiella purpurea TaxID=1249627 RepID=UPI0012FE18D4|nr:hypothetical protein [Imhoffiella purpurea]
MISQDILDCFRAVSGLFVIIGGSIAVATLRYNSKTNRSKFIFDLTDSFIKDPLTRKFWYRLDYEDWKFDLHSFRHSEEEQQIDALLYRFSVAGQLLKNRSLSHEDLRNVYPIARQFFANIEIRKYLKFNMIDFWRVAGHTDFQWPDAMYLYRKQTMYHVRQRLANPEELDDCKRFISELKRIPYERELRRSVAESIGYDRDLD